MKKLLTLLIVSVVSSLMAASFTVKPEDSVIVVDSKAGGVARLAAKELQYYIRLMTGKTVPVASRPVPEKYVFLFEKPAGVKLKPEEAVWETTGKMTRFYGDSSSVPPRADAAYVFRFAMRTGDLTAVYDFLERQLHFRFLAPGELGTSYMPAKALKLEACRNSWNPGRLIKREIRSDAVNAKRIENDLSMPAFYRKKALSDIPKRNLATLRWQKQQRLGASVRFTYGHAFTTWWKRYGAQHPEYFALHNGKRAPWGDPANIKMCPSCNALIDQIVSNWKNAKVRPSMINVCENDWGNYCECAECRKLDAPVRPGEKWDSDLTDRYLWMANEVLRRARKIDPKAKVSFYAYSVYRFPPRKFRVEPGIVIGFVPSMMTWQTTDGMYKAWRKCGAEDMFQRPNDQHINTGLPMGIEKILFDHFQIGYRNGIIGTDYDQLHGFWAATGIADYILARAHIYPDRTFEQHMDEYCSAYGAAAPEVKAYYAYWRNEVFDKRLYPNRQKIAEKGRYGNFRRGLMWDLPKYYNEKDFDLTDAILQKGLKKPLNRREKALLEQLLLSNRHARLTFHAVAAEGDTKFAAAKKLHRFRQDNWDKINMNWYRLFLIESAFGDLTGGRLAAALESFSEGRALTVRWFFRPDPKNEGDKLNWKDTSFVKAEKEWAKIVITSGWENPGSFTDPAMRKMMAKYDGIGWYALRIAVPKKWQGKQIYLRFGAVDESAWVYLNGQFCGERIYKEENDWKKPFSIRIDQNIDWTKKYQSLVVKVHDTAGQGGIWQPVMIGCKSQDASLKTQDPR